LHALILTRIAKSLNRESVEAKELARAVLGNKGKGQAAHDLAFSGQSHRQQITRRRTYFAYPVVPAVVVTSLFCWAQAPNAKAVASKATIINAFKKFNLSHLLL
jgi:hypothetical protein